MEGDLEDNLYNCLYLHQYRLTPHSTTGEPHAVLLMKRITHSRLSPISPNVREQTVFTVKQSQQKCKR